jgi:FtsZ-binding cell division protein ZapB
MADEPKPSYVRFEIRSIEDREASMEAGHYVGKDVIFALVTPAGTRDCVEREASEWIKNIEEGVNQDRIPSSWLVAYRGALEAFTKNQEAPEFGTPVIDWPSASPSQIKLLLDINVRTVEELAAANEETVQRIGMGGRALKEKAQAWLDSSKDAGKVAEEVQALRVANEALKSDNKEMRDRLTALEKQLTAMTPKEKEKA